jgi:hypothetical protein
MLYIRAILSRRPLTCNCGSFVEPRYKVVCMFNLFRIMCNMLEVFYSAKD